MPLTDFCKGRFPAGLFYLDKILWTDEGVKQAAETGADFLTGVGSSELLLGLCEKYNLGVISNSNITPSWWGGKGQKAGQYADEFPLSNIDNKNDYPPSPALWGDYPVDEPNSKDFAHINKVIKHYRERFPGKLPLINLYPNYGRHPEDSSNDVILQLGNKTYEEHIDQYVREIDLPYICFDYYPFTKGPAPGSEVFKGYLENLDIVARACRKAKKDMWVIIQTGAWTPEEMLDAFQIDWQVYMCLAYGAKAIFCACYSKGWWNETTSCVNLKGEKNKTYDYVKNIISALHSPMGKNLLEYEYLCSAVYGDVNSSDERIRGQLEKQNKTIIRADLSDIEIISDKAVMVGFFKNKSNYAAMIVNTHNPFDGSVTANVKIGNKDIRIQSGQGVLTKF